MLNNEVHYFHIRLGQMPVACLALQVSEDQTRAAFGLSIHNPRDTYSRKMGRQVALGRLTKTAEIVPVPVKSYSHIRYNILSSLMDEGTYGYTKHSHDDRRLPKRVIEAFKQHINAYLEERQRRDAQGTV